MISEETRRQLDSARQRFEQSLTRNRALLEQTRREVAELAAQQQRERVEERIDEKFQEAARSGAAGPDMQRIQEQVDRGRLSWDDVFTGQADPALTSVVRRSSVSIQRAVELGQIEAEAPADPLHRPR